MAKVTLKDINKVYDNDVTAVKGVNLTIADKEFMVIVGPSGCGKTTILRMIAGLEEVTEGTIAIDAKVVNNTPPKDRDIAMVFQNYALYPHMTVYQNMAFALKLRKTPKARIKQRVNEVAEMLGIDDILARKPKALSGGQRQRVALAKAIVRKPAAFLFDEPLSNLDAKLRISTRAELKALHHRLRTTSIYVTHDQAEAMTLGDRICVMLNGQIQQVAPPMEVYDKPVNRFVAGFLGTPPMNFLDGKIQIKAGCAALVLSDGVSIDLSGVNANLSSYADRQMVLGIRPEYLSIDQLSGRNENVIPATVDVIEPLGDRKEVYLKAANGQRFIVNLDPHIDLAIDQKVRIQVAAAKVHIFKPGIAGLNVSL